MLASDLLASLVPAAVTGALCLLAMAGMLRWWRSRLGADDAQSMRARIASTASVEGGTATVSAAQRQIPSKSGGDLGQRTVLASSFIGRDRAALPSD